MSYHVTGKPDWASVMTDFKALPETENLGTPSPQGRNPTIIERKQRKPRQSYDPPIIKHFVKSWNEKLLFIRTNPPAEPRS